MQVHCSSIFIHRFDQAFFTPDPDSFSRPFIRPAMVFLFPILFGPIEEMKIANPARLAIIRSVIGIVSFNAFSIHVYQYISFKPLAYLKVVA